MFSANLRLDDSKTQEEREQIVERTMDQLGLTPIADKFTKDISVSTSDVPRTHV